MIKKTKHTLLFILLVLQLMMGNLQSVFAQVSITPTLIGTTGNFSGTTFGSLTFSVGEPMVTTLYSGGPIILTQGFLQPAGSPTVTVCCDTAICEGSSVLLTTTVSGGQPSYTYNWFPASGLSCNNCPNPVASPSGPITYTVTVIDQTFATAFTTVSINVKPAPNLTAGVTPGPLCSGETLSLDGPDGFFAYSWTGPNGFSSSLENPIIPNITTAASGPYVVTVSNTNLCTATQTITVNVNPSPTVSITPGNPTICAGQSVVLTASGGFSYSWSTGSFSSSIIVNPPSTSTFIVTGTKNGCSDTASVVVTLNQPIQPSISSSPPPSNVCVGQTVVLTAGGGTTYLWSTGASTSSVPVIPIVVGNTTYSVTIGNGNCSADTFITLIVKPRPSISASASPDTICAGEMVTFTANGGASYLWNTGQATASFVDFPALTATYSVVGLGANGCSNFATVTVTVSSITVDAGKDVTICPGFTAQLSATVSGDVTNLWYDWSPEQMVNDSTIANPSANPDSTTTFIVSVGNIEGCYSKDSVTVFVALSPGCIIHVYNGITPNGDGNNDVWWIDGIQSFPLNYVAVFNRWGTKVWEGRKYDNDKIVWKGQNQQGEILPDGTYYYTIELYYNGSSNTWSNWVEITH